MQLGKVIVKTWVLNQNQSFLYTYRKMAFEAEMSGKQRQSKEIYLGYGK